tara:strand:- start:90 stop:431 length:342 start_codon:yes stop_codon:yes gene_type:complete
MSIGHLSELGQWQLLLIIVPIVLGILLKGVIKRFVIWAVDVAAAIGFIACLLAGGVAGAAIQEELIGEVGGTGIVLGVLGGAFLGSITFAVLFLLLSINNSLASIEKKTTDAT